VSEPASPQPWGREHSIDLGAVEAVEGPVSDQVRDPSPPRRYVYIHNIALAYTAIAIALAAAVVTVVKWSPLHRPVAESAVLSFLEAVRDGDVEGALAYTDQKHVLDAEDDESSDPGAEAYVPDWERVRTDYLTPEALDSRWEIVTVAQVDFMESGRNGRFVAQVYAEIEAYDGTRIGYRYQVAVEQGKAVIERALPKIEAWASMDYLDMNGVELELQPEIGFVNVYLLPGLYEFYPDLPPTVELPEGDAMLVLGNRFLTLGSDTPDVWMPAPYPEVTEEGEDAVNAALQKHYDDCAASGATERCALVFPEDPERELTLAPGAAWEVTAYPTVEADQLWYETGLGYMLQTAVPGEAQVQVAITEGGATRTALVSCPIWVDGLYAQLDDDGGATVSDAADLAEDDCRAVVEVD
jgi:hypothetical protein